MQITETSEMVTLEYKITDYAIETIKNQNVA